MSSSAVLVAIGSCLLALGACAVGTNPELQASLDENVPVPPPSGTSTSTSPPLPGADASPGPTDAGADVEAADSRAPVDAAPPPPPPGACTAYAAPSETAGCKCASGKSCTANNCYNGYYCSLGVTPPKCVPKPASCP